ncbi:RNA-directed DNA polymerase [Paenibacillus dendritiformis]|uniref:RNA-directed DNA polymerase n=1 Tax=Paenibacillus dendritiformis TaxID=130049 RepID=UPI00248B1915|nr:RNA-directed DNA polymerase [Paenibacillus dendritiformis]WGU93374.1 RNA-directed DNA polymerase [Paenibacillus dendritiformis]
MKDHEIKKFFEFAVENIIKFGDTDIFPYPIENHIFYDLKNETVELLLKIFKEFDDFVIKNSPLNESMLAPAGYTGFRWATQIDPIWNAYLLGLVLSIADKIEESRVPKERNMVFSYRIKLNEEEKTIFDNNFGWVQFQETSISMAGKYKFVLICDLSHFYSNIYHHRLENSLEKLNIPDKRMQKHIMDLLQRFSNIKSYGLPIGGQAARILAELLLNRTDKLLKSKSIEFCRYVDDYHIFANSENELYEHLLYLSKIFIENEGLSLQKSKTRIINSEEFISSTRYTMRGEDQEDTASKQNLFSIKLKYDPYSLTAREDYESIKEEIAKLDILGILSDELNKSRIHSPTMKKLIRSIKYLESDAKNSTIGALIENLEMLVPVFPNVMILVNDIFDELNADLQNQIITMLQNHIDEKTFIMQVELNLAYSLRVLSHKNTDENEALLIKLYGSTTSRLIKRDIILILAKWGADYWISDLKNRYHSLDLWEKRSFIMASYYLGDEGRHWREHFKDEFSPIEIAYKEWVAKKIQTKGWTFPI